MPETVKKTGATPLVTNKNLGGGRVEGVVKTDLAIVKYKDGHGEEETRLALVIPGGEVYFFNKNAIDLRPAQKWLKEEVQAQLAGK